MKRDRGREEDSTEVGVAKAKQRPKVEAKLGEATRWRRRKTLVAVVEERRMMMKIFEKGITKWRLG